MERTRRVKIVTGLKCNIQCVFCYYRDNLQAPNRPIAEIEKNLRFAYRHGIREVDFSGGEPTVHSDLPALISRAKNAGMERVCIISNGLRLAGAEYVRALKNAGLDEVLFSVHGSSPGIHDEITQSPGSFEKLRQGMKNAAGAGLTVRINTVVNRLNFRDLECLSNLVLSYRPIQCNFITLNDWCFAKHLIEKFMVSYTEMAPNLKMACDILAPHVPAVNVRYIPFCFMQGYEGFVCNHRQVPYDRYEWVPRIRAKIEEGTGRMRYLGILGYGMVFGGAFRKLFSHPLANTLDDCVTEGIRRYYYVKGPRCSKCGKRELCDGVEKTYAREYGFEELVPQEIEVVSDPIAYRRENKSHAVLAGVGLGKKDRSRG